MRKISFLILVCTVVSLYAGKTLMVPLVEQEKDQWCWVGSSKMILGYHSIDVSQGTIAQFGLGDSLKNRPNYLWGSGQFTFNSITQYQNGISKILENWGFAGRYNGWDAGEYTLSEMEWKAEIDSGNPFIINWSWNSGGDHFVVGMGYLDNGNYELMNPWFGTGYTVASYDWIKNTPNSSGNTNGSDDGYWRYTLTTNREKTGTSTEVFTQQREMFLASLVGDELTLNGFITGKTSIKLYTVNGREIMSKYINI